MKITRKENIRVEITPKSFSWLGRSPEEEERTLLSDCEQIVYQVKRHVDDVQDVEIRYDRVEYCSFCGYTWEVSKDDLDTDFPKGTPLCCEAAIDEFKNEKKV